MRGKLAFETSTDLQKTFNEVVIERAEITEHLSNELARLLEKKELLQLKLQEKAMTLEEGLAYD